MKYALTYGIISGILAISGLTAGIELGDFHSLWFGYLVMLVALTLLFVGMKRFRDVERGGVIKFLPAFGLGVGIALVAAIAYVAGFEAYLAATNYTFFDDFIAGQMREAQAAGLTGAALAAKAAEFEDMRVMLQNPLARMALVAIEILPVGLVVALVSAALLRNPKFMRSAG
jgi:hypothetical protein